MQALRMKVQIHDNQIATRLPVSMPDGEAEIIVLYEEQIPSGTNGKQTLLDLFAKIDQAPHPRMTKEEVDAYLTEERASWD